ncbi:MAG: FG-GAP-like repeat-containing protein [Phycisphaerales bacterium]|nr:FG-GAP-like repeat-containing protein [Phycisphaerales bacterium]
MPAAISTGVLVFAMLGASDAPRFDAPVRILANGEPIDVTTGHAAPYLRDMDGDGIRDLLVGEFGDGTYTGPVHEPGTPGHEWANGRLRIYRNHGSDADPRFEDFEYLQAGGKAAAVPITCCVSFVPQFVDYDNDGTTDVFSSSYPGDMYLFKGLDDGEWSAGVQLMDAKGDVLLPWKMVPEKYREPGKSDRYDVHSTTAELHDIDGDGDLDLLVGSRLDGCYSIKNIGTRSAPRWSTETVPLATTDGTPIGGWDYGSNVHVFDWDLDGVSDILVGSEDGGVFWHRNKGTESNPAYESVQVLIPPMTRDEMFAKLESPVRNGSRCKVHAADWDGDGLTDLLVGDFGSSWHKVRDLTEQQVGERARIEAELEELGEEGVPLWNAETLTPKQASRRDEIDATLSTLYDQLEPLETHQHESHGWVWLYRQLPAPVSAPEDGTETAQANGHVRMTCSVPDAADVADEVRAIDVHLAITPGWTIAPASERGGSIPTKIHVSLPTGYVVEGIDWPDPRRKQVNGKSTSHYEGSITARIFVAPDGKDLDTPLQYTVHGSWQACNTRSGICLRGSTIITSRMR